VDGITILALAILLLVVIVGLVLAFVAIRLTRKRERGRGAVVLLAFSLPTLYVAYLLTAGHFRNGYHRFHSQAFEAEGFNNLVLGNGYQLWFFDETPWMSSIAKRPYENAEITNIQRLSLEGTRVLGQTGTTDMFDGPTDYYFDLDLSSGAIEKFNSETELRASTTTFGPMLRPEELYNTTLEREHSDYFWPLICLAPIGLVVGGIWGMNRRRNRDGSTPSVFASDRSQKVVP
jgi:hypothetical protein